MGSEMCIRDRPRTDTHTPRLSRLCCLLLAPRSLSLSVRPQPFRPCFICLPPTCSDSPLTSGIPIPVMLRAVYIGTPSPVCVCTLCEALSHGSSLGQLTLTNVYSCATPCMRQQLRPLFRWPQLKSFRWPQLQCAGQTCVFSKTMYLDRQRYTVFWPYTICRPNTKTKISRTTTHTHIHTDGQFFFSCM